MALSRMDALLVGLALPQPLFPPPEVSPGQAAQLLQRAECHSVLPAVVRNLKVPAPSNLIAAAGFTVLLRLRLEQLQSALRQRRLPCVVLKGAEFADRLYPEPALRGFTDLDLMVPESARAQTEETLRALGYRQQTLSGLSHAEPYGESLWLSGGRGQFGVEVHWNLVNSPAVQKGVSVRFADLQFEPGGRLSAASLLLIAAVHAAASHQFDRLGLLVDVRQIVTATAGSLDLAYLAQTSRHTGARLCLISALDLTWQLWKEPASRELRRQLGWQAEDGLSRLLLSPKTVLRPNACSTRLRRRLYRQLLKRR